MVYSDIKRFGLHNVLPKKKRYGSEKDKRIVKDAILNNKEFVKFALQNSNAKSDFLLIKKIH